MKSQTYLGSALVALGVATGSLMAPQAASALDFNFSFGGVEGLITGLVEGVNSCDALSGCVVSVQNDGGTGASLGQYDYVGGSFEVSSGSIIAASWLGGLNGNLDQLGVNNLPYINNAISQLLNARGPIYPGYLAQGNVSFTVATSSVPGPLPLFGAAAAFGFSRKLRNRINVTRTTAPTRPAG